eukprot:753596-Hanusia_phi.AAC.3
MNDEGIPIEAIPDWMGTRMLFAELSGLTCAQGANIQVCRPMTTSQRSSRGGEDFVCCSLADLFSDFPFGLSFVSLFLLRSTKLDFLAVGSVRVRRPACVGTWRRRRSFEDSDKVWIKTSLVLECACLQAQADVVAEPGQSDRER